MVAPLLVFYEVSILLISRIDKKRAERQAAEEAAAESGAGE
jgi:Sec-independent protein secretion pathway component TatC